MLNRSSRENSYLHPGLLRYHRHAISVDETSPLRQSNDSAHGSQVSFDPTPEIIDIAPVHKKRLSKRSDTSRKHVLSRQKPIEKEEAHHNNNGSPCFRRRNSTLSDNSILSRKATMQDSTDGYRRASTTSRTFSIESRYTQNASISSTNDLCRSPEKQQSPIKVSSICSIDKDFRYVFESNL